MYRLVVTTDGSPEQHAFDLERDVALVGRRAGADVPLPHADVGGVHVRLERQGAQVVLVDGAIASGTVVNGVHVDPGARRTLADGDEIVVARRFRLRFVAISPAAAATGGDATAALARAMVRDVLASLSEAAPETTPWLEVVAGGSSGLRQPLPAPGRSLVLGRGEGCDVALRDPDLSREHVRLTRSWAGTTVADLGSKNGTIAGGDRVAVGVERPLKDGERIEIGGTVIVFRDPTEAYLRQLAAAASAPAPAEIAEDIPPTRVPPTAPPAAAEPAPSAPPVPEPTPSPPEPAPRRPSRLPFAIALLVILGAAAALIQLLRS